MAITHPPGAGAPIEERIVAFLESEGAGSHGHTGGRTLLAHLVDTAGVLRRWEQPLVLQHASLIHSVYGTDGGRPPLLPLGRRDDVRSVVGDAAERLAYLFCVTPRRLLLSGTYRWLRQVPLRAPLGPGEQPPDRDTLDALVLLHMANIADQARAPDGSPRSWLVRFARLAELIGDSHAVTLPPVVAGVVSLTEDDEALLRSSYTTAAEDPATAADRYALAAAICPVIGEPCLWLAHLAHQSGDSAAASAWATQGQRRLTAFGVAWDKRLRYPEWLTLAERLEQPSLAGADTALSGDPRLLYEAYGAGAPPRATRARAAGQAAPTRFEGYVEALFAAGADAIRTPYPDLESKPWYDPAEFPLTGYLEGHYEQIRDEILALDPASFQRESERIGRSGDWDVAFFYERGRRRDEVCAACPVTTQGIEISGTVRTLAGLIYASRMRPGTHIAAHRGPTNLRLRCHLGIQIPDGDCAIRVGEETRRWEEGRCIVFDDHFEHEAWNHTGQDRLVLIVDLWHPALTAREVRLLQGLHGFAQIAGRQVAGYWARNDAAAGEAG